MRFGVRSRLFLVSFVLLTIAALCSGLYLESQLRSLLVARTESQLLSHAMMACETLATLPADVSDDRVQDLANRLGRAIAARVTLIRADGVVVGDSELTGAAVRDVESHLDRPEIRQAMAQGSGISHRLSATLRARMIYGAERCEVASAATVVRVALPLVELEDVIWRLRLFVLVAGLIGLGLATFMSGLASHLASRSFRSLVEKARDLARGERSRIDIRSSGEIGHLAGSINRMSEDLERAVRSLAEERDRFHTVLEGMDAAVLTVDREHRITLVNATALEYLGLERPPVGRPLFDVVRAPELEQPLARDDEGAPSSSVEFDVTGPGRRRLLTRVTPLRAGSGHVLVIHDVSERKRLETIRRDFVANVSHELRTPISVILANTETLLDGAMDDRAQASRFLAAVHSNAGRLSQLIADLLDLSSIEAGRYPMRLERLRLEPTFRSVADSMQSRAVGKNQSVKILPTDGVVALADPNALEQILLNLLDNALKYTPAGGRIEVGARSEGATVRVEVEDDGPGVEPRHRERLFERFYRVDPGRSRELGGTGLGLAIVKHLVESMGGRVGLDPRPSGGSLFWFTLSAAVGETRSSPTESTSPNRPA